MTQIECDNVIREAYPISIWNKKTIQWKEFVAKIQSMVTPEPACSRIMTLQSNIG